jgi:O-antigen/teichoic acid export membrane protein
VILYQSLKFVASWLCGGPVAAGHIGLVVSIAQTLAVAFVPLAAVLQPRVADLFSSGRKDAIPELLGRSLATGGLIVVPIVVFLGIEARTVFDAWVGRSLDLETIDLLARTMRWMLVGQGLYVLFLPCFYALLGIGEHRVFGLGMLLAGVVTVVASVVLVPFWPSIETLGVIFGVVLGALMLLVTVPVAIRRFGLDRLRILIDAVGVPLLVSAVGGAILMARPVLSEPILDLALAAALFVAFTAPCAWLGRRRLIRDVASR